ncbi:uncharacterized protein [Euwallacea similis]|uniref:uncharacterized protein n=1 Tax=Euwallacea similis TaxID=1736056 RepID=UPI00345045EE
MWRQICLISALILLIQIASNEAGKRTCGGTYTAARGILATPNFPGPFDVPIRCQWVIDASNAVSANTSIIVYLTQLFTFEGLTFTEFQLYGSDYKINPKLIHKVNETNVIRTRFVQTYQSYLVIELKMQSAESAHLRVLDKFLDTYGFNITYEITTTGVRSPSCNMMDCGFTGVCFDHYTKFSCTCFEGYSGPKCSEGPKSFCYTNGTPTCKNGGTCLHVGVAAVKCHCSKLFTGNTCETPLEQVTAKAVAECPNCSTNCTYDGRLENACKCLSGKTDISGQPGLFATLHLGNLPPLKQEPLKAYIQTQLLRYLRVNVSKTDDLTLISLVHYMSGADVTFQVYGPKKEEKKVKNILNKWADRGYVGNITVAQKDNSIKTPLSIQSVDINQPGVIRENDEFILSCVARGSPSMTFRWFKDGTFVNLTYARHKWIKLIKDPHVTDQYTALLAVERAQKYDEGKFTCQVEDFNIQQCMSKFVKVKRRPLVKIEPMSLTVRKGRNFTVKCVTLEGNGGIGGKYTYSWTKNKELLPVRTDSEKYETLYPAGTILQVFRVEKDVRYSCLVQDSTTSSEKSIQIYVLDREGVHTCPEEVTYDLIWPETAPDTDCIQDCPKDYSGIVSRRCMLSYGRTPKWGIPDFSQCTSKFLGEIYNKYEKTKLGYPQTSLEELFLGFQKYISSVELRSGEGARVLSLLEEMTSFLEQLRVPNHTLQNLTSTVIKVLDSISISSEALVHPKEISLLQKILFDQLRKSGSYRAEVDGFKSSNLSLNTLDITVAKETSSQTTLYVPAMGRKLGGQTWVSAKLTAQRSDPIYSDIFAGIIYRNLTQYFPPKSFLRTRDGSEVQYQLFSKIMTFVPISPNRSKSDEVAISIDFQHMFSTDLINASNNERWEVRCGYSDRTSFAYSWDIYTCSSEFIDDRTSTCLCPKFGSYVLILVLTQPEEVTESNEPHKYVLICSFFLCIILTLFTTVCLGISCFLTKSSCLIILKLQCSMSLCLCEVLFAAAILREPPQRYLMVFLTFLEMFMLLGISSHLSKLLIVFTELIEMPKSMSSKYTVMGIISGVPLITIFGNHLAYKTMNLSLKSWWMMENTLAFNVFITVVSIMSGLFVFIYVSVIKKLKGLIVTREKHERAVKKRISLIKRAGCLFMLILGFIISSIVYINNQKLVWSIYQFGGVNFIMGLVLITCYILKSETGFKNLFKQKFENEEAFFSIDSTGPLHFMTKQEAELENQSGQRRLDIQQISLKSLETTKINGSKTQSISNAFESCLQTSSNFCDVSVKEAPTLRKDRSHPDLQSYSGSPPGARKLTSISGTFSQSPDILTAKPCVGLDLVAHSMCASKNETQVIPSEPPHPPPALKTEKKPGEHKTVRIMFPPQVIITPDEAISRLLETETTAVQTERTQPDGHADIVSNREAEEGEEATLSPRNTSFSKDNLDGVLDSISHDLDYLLNRSEETETSMGASTLTRKVSKPPGASVMNKIPEELVVEEGSNGGRSAGPERIMLRTNC